MKSSARLLVEFYVLVVAVHFGLSIAEALGDGGPHIGSPCSNDVDCKAITNGKCSVSSGPGVCICDGYFHADENLTCVAGNANVGSTCYNGAGCESLMNGNCSSSTSKGKCICEPGFHSTVNGDCAAAAVVGDYCTDNVACSSLQHGRCISSNGKGSCTCSDHFHANESLLCVAGDANVGSICMNGVGCESLAHSSCSTLTGKGTCTCVNGTHYDGNATCVTAKVGDPCWENRKKNCDTLVNGKCNSDGDGYCTCLPNFHADDNLDCVRGQVKAGDSCMNGAGCETLYNGHCSSYDGPGLCICDHGYTSEDCLRDSELGDACSKYKNCTGNTECTSAGFCTCKAGFYAGDDLICVAGNATIGITCTNNVGCEKVTGSQCNAAIGKGQCACKDGMHASDDGKSCVNGNATIGSWCNNNVGCEQVTGLKCSVTDGMEWCTCDDGFYENDDGRTCFKVIGSTCDDYYYNPCDHLLGNTTCKGGKCQCQSGYLEISSMCKPGAGGRCNGDDDCVVQHATCFHGECVCEQNYKVNQGICRPGLHVKCDATDNPCIDSVAFCGQGKTCQCKDQYQEYSLKCRAPYNMTCSPDDGCITKKARCINTNFTVPMCLCPEGQYYAAYDECSGSIASLTLWAAILSISLRFMM
ncbi:multiple epidermal growth factor-like domains protein 10 isoform X2 [Ischnura elegans]|uniref:multiple epidermal growth factor-like domains protein 10 isoform X2 n=1 Tax=Ischnura elegans TaxID=197161 RepID=UPI001ED89B8E|nr:multiple epidermal growth factor-like domains protein 10 isoform X2 [Ischnura elegans]